MLITFSELHAGHGTVRTQIWDETTAWSVLALPAALQRNSLFHSILVGTGACTEARLGRGKGGRLRLFPSGNFPKTQTWTWVGDIFRRRIEALGECAVQPTLLAHLAHQFQLPWWQWNDRDGQRWTCKTDLGTPLLCGRTWRTDDPTVHVRKSRLVSQRLWLRSTCNVLDS